MNVKNEVLEDVKVNPLLLEKERLSKQITTRIAIITPKMATIFLSQNLNNKSIKNRRIDSKSVERYVSDIKNNKWKLGQPLLFDMFGNLIDGQNRCTAIVKANKPILAMIIEGYDREIFDILDNGKKRSARDVLMTLKSKEGDILDKPGGISGALHLIHNYKKNYVTIGKTRDLTNAHIYSVVKNDFHYYNTPYKSKQFQKWRKKIDGAIPENVIAAIYFKNKKTFKTEMNVFFDTICSNNSTTPQVVREFRDMMMVNKGKKSDERGYLSAKSIFHRIELLLKYNQQKGGLDNRKHFSKNDLIIR